jgi:uncharacterized transporter YbjL
MTDLTPTLEVWKFAAGEHKALWTYFITVSTAVVGFAFSDKFPAMPKLPKVSLVVAYAGFLLSNVISLYFNLCVYNAATAELRNFPEQLGRIAGSLTITPVLALVAGHLALDVVTVALVIHRGFHKSNVAPGNSDCGPLPKRGE